MKTSIGLITLCALLSGPMAGQVDSAQGGADKELPQTKNLNYHSDNKKQNGLDSLVDEAAAPFMQDPANCALSIGISVNGTRRFYNYGEVKRQTNTVPDEQTIYEIGSVSNTFCALLLAQAVLEKKISLEEDIRHYLPGKYHELTYEKKPILVKHLANHSSGLPSVPTNLSGQTDFDSLNPYGHYNRLQIYTYLKNLRLTEAPGSDCQYSALGMALLGLILENVYHEPFDSLVRQKIVRPLGLSGTGIRLSEAQRQRFAEGYTAKGQATPHWEMSDFAAAGGLRSTTEDLLKFADYHLGQKTAESRLVTQVTFSQRQKVGLAWFLIKTREGNQLVWYTGGTYGFSCFIAFIPETGCSLVILSNSLASLDRIGLTVLSYLQVKD